MTRREKRDRKRRRSIISLVGTMLILAGISLALFFLLTNVYNSCFLAEALEEEIKESLTAEPESLPPEADRQEEEEKKEEFPETLLPGEAALHIPELDLLVNVNYGVEEANLRKGPGFYPQSGYPDTGNVSIAGHRTTYGAPFRHLDTLEQGDEILLYYQEAVYIYEVEEVFEIDKRDWSVIDQTDKPALTLTTCHPPGWATQRLAVRAYLATKR